MEYEFIRDKLFGMFAYDTCGSNFGIRDVKLEGEIVHFIQNLPASIQRRSLVARLVIDCALSDDALSKGYGPEDALAFLEWCEDTGILL